MPPANHYISITRSLQGESARSRAIIERTSRREDFDLFDSLDMQNWQDARKYFSYPDGIGMKVFFYEEISSTQIPAKEAARSGESHGTVFVTNHQTAGRGRRDRGWESPAGKDLTFSVILRPHIEMRHLPILNFAIAIAIVRVLERAVGQGRAGLKWPNDVLIGEGGGQNGQKICGMICETAARGNMLDFAVAGIGINVNRTADELPRFEGKCSPATSLLRETGQTYNLPRLLAEILSELNGCVPQTECEAGRAALLAEYRARCCTLGREVAIVTEDGVFRGIAAGVEDDGRIRITGREESRTFDAGDVIHARIDTDI